MNIIDYVERRNRTFGDTPFCIVDSLVLAQLSYVKIEEVLKDLGVNCTDMDALPQQDLHMELRDYYRAEYFDRMFSDGITDGNNLQLFRLAAANPRFRNMEIRHVAVCYDPDLEQQFAAMTFVLEPGVEYIAFRGTDGSMLGWKEDFNLAFMDEIPSQKLAVRYLELCHSLEDEHCEFYVGGHSKGGNLAQYGSLSCSPEARCRIRAVYCLDAPGFRRETTERLEHAHRESGLSIVRIVPQSSLVGMLLQEDEDYRVVDSDALGLMQHSAYSWQITGKDFCYRDDLTASGAYVDRTIHDWLKAQDDDHRKVFVNTIFGFLEQNNLTTVSNFRKLRPSDIPELISSLRAIDDETLSVILKMLRGLAGSAFRQIPDRGTQKD